MPTTMLMKHPRCDAHDTGPAHPEGADRLPAILRAVHSDSELSGAIEELEARPATIQDLLRVHTPEHVARVRDAAEAAARTDGIVWLDPDTAVSGLSFEAALAAAGCAIDAAELVARGAARAAFACSRPPGHHATADQAMGFCLFDNVAIAARHLQDRFGLRRLLVVDWDVHHGNGTQAIFWEDPSVYYLSLHLSPHYPGTGAPWERGGGAGEGTTLNVPLPPGTTAAAYRAAFGQALGVALADFDPQFVLISAGFDLLAGDPLGGLLLEPEDLHALASEVVERTRASAGGRVAAVLEGGYLPERMGLAVVNVLRAFTGLPASSALGQSAPAAP